MFVWTKYARNWNKMAVDCQLLIEQSSKFFSDVLDNLESVSALKNTLNTFWSLGDHNDPSTQNFSYNELCRPNNATTSLFQQPKLVLHQYLNIQQVNCSKNECVWELIFASESTIFFYKNQAHNFAVNGSLHSCLNGAVARHNSHNCLFDRVNPFKASLSTFIFIH